MTEWRVGNHYQIHVYEGDRPVATFHNPEDAQRAVRAVNRTGWQPIETAPKDGTEIWLYDPSSVLTWDQPSREYLPKAYQQVGCWATWAQDSHWNMIDMQTGGYIGASPTHWMPLPEPPSET
jgi:hypothetical protein